MRKLIALGLGAGLFARIIICIPIVFWLVIPAVGRTTIKAPPKLEQPAMEIQIVRDAGPDCEPDCLEWISAQGRIVRETPALLRKAIRDAKGRHLPVLLYSPGGEVEAGFAMGRMIRGAGLDTVIAKVEIVPPCDSGPGCSSPSIGRQPRGNFRIAQAMCASSCVFVFSGGKRRFVDQNSYAGVHQMIDIQTTIHRKYLVTWQRVGGQIIEMSRKVVSDNRTTSTYREDSPNDQLNKRSEAYFKEMGIDASIMALLVATPNETLHFMTREELSSTKLATELNGAEALLDGGRKARLLDASVVGRMAYQRAAVLAETNRARATITSMWNTATNSDMPSAPELAPAQVVSFGVDEGKSLALSLTFRDFGDLSYRVPGIGLEAMLLRDGKPAPSQALNLNITLRGGLRIIAVNPNVSAPDGPLMTEIAVSNLCFLSVTSVVRYKLIPRGADSTQALASAAGPAEKMLPLDALKSALCK